MCIICKQVKSKMMPHELYIPLPLPFPKEP